MGKNLTTPADDGDGDEQTSIRIHKADARDLKALAGLMDLSISDTYRTVCARVVSGALAAAAKKRAVEAERDAKGT